MENIPLESVVTVIPVSARVMLALMTSMLLCPATDKMDTRPDMVLDVTVM